VLRDENFQLFKKNLNIQNGDIIIMTSMSYYYYFQVYGVVQMMVIDKKIFSYVLVINNIWRY
jgi:hypothetical protein